jgi:hypothetical protein
MIFTLMLSMVASLVALFVLFAPPANTVFQKHPQCSVAGFNPDLTVNERAFCRAWRKK